MKCVVDRSALLKTLGHVQSVVERRTTLPILSNVRIAANDNALMLTATDMDISIATQIEARVADGATTTVSAHTLYDIVRKLPDGVEIEIAGNTAGQPLQLQAGAANFSLSTLPADEFPNIDEGELEQRFTIQSAELIRLIDRTRFAISTEETRYYLNGIYLHTVEDQLRAVATDGHRLAQCEIPKPEGIGEIGGIIIPRKTISELRKLLEETDGEVQVLLNESKIRFICGKAVLLSKLIEGNFPDYGRVIPTGNDKKADIDAAMFAEAADRVATIASDKSRAIKAIFSQGRLELVAQSPEHGTAREEITIDYTSEPLEIGFNSRYLLDVLGQIGKGSVQLFLSDTVSPILIRDGSDAQALYVIMPMRV